MLQFLILCSVVATVAAVISLLALVNDAALEVVNVSAVAVISLLTLVNAAAVADVVAVAFISYVALVNDAAFALVNVAAVEVFNLSVAAVTVINAVAVALITDRLSTRVGFMKYMGVAAILVM